MQAFAIYAVLSAQGPPKISVKEWSCGFTETHKQYTYDLLEGRCAKYKATVNLCCAKHKDCLIRCNLTHFETEARECTSDLCLCLEVPAGKKDGCGYKVYESCYNALTNLKFVKIKMEDYVDKSYKSVMPYGFHEESVRNVYAGCEVAQKYTTRACAVRHNECLLAGGHECREDFKHCMSCANMKLGEGVQEQSCSTAIDGLKLDPSVKYSPPPMPHDTAVPSEASPVKVTTVPSEVSKKALKKGGSTSANHIAVLVTVAVACAVELLQYGMSIDEQEKVQKLEVKGSARYMADATHLIDKPLSINKEVISCI